MHGHQYSGVHFTKELTTKTRGLAGLYSNITFTIYLHFQMLVPIKSKVTKYTHKEEICICEVIRSIKFE